MDSSKATGLNSAVHAAAGEQGWLTTVLRPAGRVDRATAHKLGAALAALADASDMVMVDLSAADVRNPRALAAALREPAAAFARTERCLLVTGASAELTAELERAAVAAVTLAPGAVPPAQAGPHSAWPGGRATAAI
jgi:hypothetical protein